jgi:hypothetical protein
LWLLEKTNKNILGALASSALVKYESSQRKREEERGERGEGSIKKTYKKKPIKKNYKKKL